MSLNGTWDFQIKPRPDAATVEALTAAELVADPGARQLDDAGLRQSALHQRADAVSPAAARTCPPTTPPASTGAALRCPQTGRAAASCCTSAAAKACCTCYLNGKPVGLSKDARTPAEFDVTDLVQHGAPNELVVVVVQWSDASPLSKTRTTGGRPASSARCTCTPPARRTCRMSSPAATWTTTYQNGILRVKCQGRLSGRPGRPTATVEAAACTTRPAPRCLPKCRSGLVRRVQVALGFTAHGRQRSGLRAARAGAPALVGRDAGPLHPGRHAADAGRRRKAAAARSASARSRSATGSC